MEERNEGSGTFVYYGVPYVSLESDYCTTNILQNDIALWHWLMWSLLPAVPALMLLLVRSIHNHKRALGEIGRWR